MDSRFPHLRVAARTDIGRKRSNNEDAFGVFQKSGVFCVSDGMGGGDDGEVASSATVKAIEDFCRNNPFPAGATYELDDLVEGIRGAADSASSWIFARAREKRLKGCGATFVGVCFDAASPGEAVALHAGDSRLYRIRGRGIQQITKDHSAAELIGAKNEKDVNPMFRGMILRAVGIQPSVELERTPLPVREGDVVLICSDGLSRMVPDNKMLSIVREHGATDEGVEALISAANTAGGVDNITVVLVGVGRIPAPIPAQRLEVKRAGEGGARPTDNETRDSDTSDTDSGKSSDSASTTRDDTSDNSLATGDFGDLSPSDDLPDEAETCGTAATRTSAEAVGLAAPLPEPRTSVSDVETKSKKRRLVVAGIILLFAATVFGAAIGMYVHRQNRAAAIAAEERRLQMEQAAAEAERRSAEKAAEAARQEAERRVEEERKRRALEEKRAAEEAERRARAEAERREAERLERLRLERERREAEQQAEAKRRQEEAERERARLEDEKRREAAAKEARRKEEERRRIEAEAAKRAEAERQRKAAAEDRRKEEARMKAEAEKRARQEAEARDRALKELVAASAEDVAGAFVSVFSKLSLEDRVDSVTAGFKSMRDGGMDDAGLAQLALRITKDVQAMARGLDDYVEYDLPELEQDLVAKDTSDQRRKELRERWTRMKDFRGKCAEFLKKKPECVSTQLDCAEMIRRIPVWFSR